MELCLREHELGVALPGAVRAFAMKKYKRHRSVPTGLLNELETALVAKRDGLRERERKGKGKKEAVQAKIALVSLMLGGLAAAKPGQTANVPP